MRQPAKRFLYKIWTRYDGFTPQKIPERLDARGRLRLGWVQYLDLIDVGAEVWIYFHGSRSAGVYVKGFVDEVDQAAACVFLRLREISTDQPLTDAATNVLVAEAVAQRYRQVFFLPQTLLQPVADCTLDNCKARHCDRCDRWRAIPLIEDANINWPGRLPAFLTDFVAAYWVVPSRCFLWYEGSTVSTLVDAGSDLFYRFKTGEARLAYPLARGVYEILRRRRTLAFDCVVPVPLSPDKVEAQELNRTLALAREIAALLGTKVRPLLSLAAPISKRRLRNDGVTIRQFEQRYTDLLEVDVTGRGFSRVLLVDDVCDHGSTLRCATTRLLAEIPGLEIVGAAAGQMIVKEAVRDQLGIVA
jgi:hypothetical protein